MVTEGKARPSLMTRVARANKKGADLFLSIHHDSVPGIYNESWEFEGKKRHFNDLFGGYSVFVSQRNPRYGESLRFAKLLGNQMADQQLNFARQYDLWFMGKYQRPLLDSDAGVYRYDELIVLKMTSMPAVLLESGSIINRDEELVMASDAHKNKVATAVTGAVSDYCETRGVRAAAGGAAEAKHAENRKAGARRTAARCFGEETSAEVRADARGAEALTAAHSGIFRYSRLARPASSRSRSRSMRRRASSVILPLRSKVWMHLRSIPIRSRVSSTPSAVVSCAVGRVRQLAAAGFVARTQQPEHLLGHLGIVGHRLQRLQRGRQRIAPRRELRLVLGVMLAAPSRATPSQRTSGGSPRPVPNSVTRIRLKVTNRIRSR